MPILAFWVLLTAAPVHPTLMQNEAPTTPVIVKLGTASLEEYRHGDPANRVQMTRG